MGEKGEKKEREREEEPAHQRLAESVMNFVEAIMTGRGGTSPATGKSEEIRQLLSLPSGEVLMDDFNCALMYKGLLLQGKLYLFCGYLGFYANIFGNRKQVALPFSEIAEVNRAKTANIFPNAIEVIAGSTKLTFSSFIMREEAYRMLLFAWARCCQIGKERLRDQAPDLDAMTSLTAEKWDKRQREVLADIQFASNCDRVSVTEVETVTVTETVCSIEKPDGTEFKFSERTTKGGEVREAEREGNRKGGDGEERMLEESKPGVKAGDETEQKRGGEQGRVGGVVDGSEEGVEREKRERREKKDNKAETGQSVWEGEESEGQDAVFGEELPVKEGDLCPWTFSTEEDVPEFPEAMEVVATCTLPVAPELVFRHLFSDKSDFLYRLYTEGGSLEYTSGPWELENSSSLIRSVQFKHPLSIPFAPESARCRQKLRAQVFQENRLMVQMEQNMADIPNGDCFSVHTWWIVEPIDKSETPCSSVSVSVEVRFSKKFFWQVFVEKKTMGDMREWAKKWVEKALEEVATKSDTLDAATDSPIPLVSTDEKSLHVSLPNEMGEERETDTSFTSVQGPFLSPRGSGSGCTKEKTKPIVLSSSVNQIWRWCATRVTGEGRQLAQRMTVGKSLLAVMLAVMLGMQVHIASLLHGGDANQSFLKFCSSPELVSTRRVSEERERGIGCGLTKFDFDSGPPKFTTVEETSLWWEERLGHLQQSLSFELEQVRLYRKKTKKEKETGTGIMEDKKILRIDKDNSSKSEPEVRKNGFFSSWWM